MWPWHVKMATQNLLLLFGYACHSLTDSLTDLFSRLDGYEWYQLLDVFASATESCEKVETSCVSCPPQLVKVIKFSTDSKSADNLKVVGNISESKLLVCWQDTNQYPNPELLLGALRRTSGTGFKLTSRSAQLMRTHLKRAFTCLVSELVSNPTGYFGKMNSTLGSVVPLAMFEVLACNTF